MDAGLVEVGTELADDVDGAGAVGDLRSSPSRVSLYLSAQTSPAADDRADGADEHSIHIEEQAFGLDLQRTPTFKTPTWIDAPFLLEGSP